MAFFQFPWLPEAALSAGHGYLIGEIFSRTMMHREQLPDDFVRLYRRQACEPGALTAMVNYYRAALRGGGAMRQRRMGYPIVSVPTLVIWGLHDHALVSENLEGLNDFVTDLTVIKVSDAGHFVHEDKPEKVTGEILTWLHHKLPA
jgi:pimeloyl-ACP methyl ester carboxylesterase